jgi:hypothetical protein
VTPRHGQNPEKNRRCNYATICIKTVAFWRKIALITASGKDTPPLFRKLNAPPSGPVYTIYPGTQAAHSSRFVAERGLGACGAFGLYSALGVGGTTLQYFNTANSTWVTGANIPVTGNSLSAFEGNGTLYFASQVTAPQTMYRATLQQHHGRHRRCAGQREQHLGAYRHHLHQTAGAQATITAPSMVGATLDRDTGNRRMFLYITTGAAVGQWPNLPVDGGGTSSLAAIGILDPEDPTNVSWTTVYQTTGTGTVTYPRIGGSGDIFADQQSGAIWIATNTPNNYMLELGLTYSGFTISRAQVLGSASIQVSAVNLQRQLASVAVDPTSGLVYISERSNSVHLAAD